MGGAGSQTRSVMQTGLVVHAGIAVTAVRPVTHGAVRVTTQTLPSLFVFEKPLGTVWHAQALVEEVILLTSCTENRFQPGTERQFTTVQ